MVDNDISKIVNEAIDSKSDEIAGVLSKLVQIPSSTGEEGEAQKYMKELYSKLGLEIVAFEPDIKKLKQTRAFVYPDAPEDRYRNRPNVIGTLKGKSSARSLKLNAHVDTVTPEPVKNWELSPWSGKVLGNRLYGRGAVDDKSGLIINYFALKGLLDAGIKPKGTVILESVVDEEDGGGGTLASLLEGYTADGIVVTDSVPAIVVAAAGLDYCKVRVKGKSIHASFAEWGVSAITKMNKVCQALVELDEKRGQMHYPLFLLGGRKLKTCNLVIGTYRAGDWRGSVPGWAEIECRMDSIPGETANEVRKQVEKTIMKVAYYDEWLRDNPPEITWIRNANEPWEQDVSHPFVQTFKSCADMIVDGGLPITGVPHRTDASFAQAYGIPGVICGAAGKNAHAADEYVDLDMVSTMSKIVSLFIAKWCGTEQG